MAKKSKSFTYIDQYTVGVGGWVVYIQLAGMADAVYSGVGDAGGNDCDGAIFDLLIQSGDVVWRVDGQLVGVEGGDVEDVEECFLCGDQSTCISQKQV